MYEIGAKAGFKSLYTRIIGVFRILPWHSGQCCSSATNYEHQYRMLKQQAKIMYYQPGDAQEGESKINSSQRLSSL